MTISATTIGLLIDAGLAGETLKAVTAAIETDVTRACALIREQLHQTPLPERSLDALRQARYRERRGIITSEWGAIRGAIRADVLKRDDYCCQYCGEYANACDHVIPLAAGGPTDLENLVAACDRCNSSKRDRPLNEWEATKWR